MIKDVLENVREILTKGAAKLVCLDANAEKDSNKWFSSKELQVLLFTKILIQTGNSENYSQHGQAVKGIFRLIVTFKDFKFMAATT